MKRPGQFSQLSPPRQDLVRLFQSINYGYVRDLNVLDREPVLASRPPIVVVDLKLDVDQLLRDEVTAVDFELCAEVGRLMSLLDRIRNGKISSIEVRAGIPRRILFEKSLTEGGELVER